MDEVHAHCVFNLETGMFNLAMTDLQTEKSFKCNLSPDQFLGMAQYFAKVGVAYQEWLKNGGK